MQVGFHCNFPENVFKLVTEVSVFLSLPHHGTQQYQKTHHLISLSTQMKSGQGACLNCQANRSAMNHILNDFIGLKQRIHEQTISVEDIHDLCSHIRDQIHLLTVRNCVNLP